MTPETVRMECRQAVRGLVRNPLFAVAALLMLGLGIGVNVGMFEIVDRLLLRPPPFLRHPDAVHRVYATRIVRGERVIDAAFSYPALRELSQSSSTVEIVAAHFTRELVVGTGEAARPYPVTLASAGFWSLFAAPPALGRYFSASDDRLPSGTAVAVLGHAFWRSEFGAAGNAIGQSLQIGSRVYTIVGVAPQGFAGLDSRTDAAAYVPLTAAAADIAGGEFAQRPWSTWLGIVVQGRPDADARAASAELERAYQAMVLREGGVALLERTAPGIALGSAILDRGPLRSDASRISVWLLGMGVIVLLIACANLSNMLLARSLRQQREMAIRLALGAGRTRLVSRHVIENLVLAAGAGLLAVPLAYGTVAIIGGVLMGDAGVHAGRLDARALLIGAALIPLIVVLISLVPVVRILRADLSPKLRQGQLGGGDRTRAQSVLVVSQAVLSTVLLVAAGLFVRSFQAASQVDMGYDAGQLVVISPDVRGPGYNLDEYDRLIAGLLDGVRTQPGVVAATRSTAIPFWRNSYEAFFVPGLEEVAHRGQYATHVVAGDYFETMGTRILRGRAIRDTDDAGAARVVVVSEGMAEVLWPGEEALGRCIRLVSETSPCSEVVGVAQNIRRGDFRDDLALQYYVPRAQYGRQRDIIVARMQSDAQLVTEPLRDALQARMPARVYVRAEPLQTRVERQTRNWYIGATVFTAFGTLAIVLAALGLFSLVSYDMARRTRELGIRKAVGATSLNLTGLVVRESMLRAGVGTAIGLLLAGAVVPRVESLLFRVPARDPATFVFAGLVLLIAGAAASVPPAIRATRVDPMTVLRAD